MFFFYFWPFPVFSRQVAYFLPELFGPSSPCVSIKFPIKKYVEHGGRAKLNKLSRLENISFSSNKCFWSYQYPTRPKHCRGYGRPLFIMLSSNEFTRCHTGVGNIESVLTASQLHQLLHSENRLAIPEHRRI